MHNRWTYLHASLLHVARFTYELPAEIAKESLESLT